MDAIVVECVQGGDEMEVNAGNTEGGVERLNRSVALSSA